MARKRINTNKNTNNFLLGKPSLRGTFFLFWLATIFSFVFTLDPKSRGTSYSSFLGILFLGNIILGVIFFAGIFFHKAFKKFNDNKFVQFAPIIAVAYFFFYVLALTANGNGLIAGISMKNNVVELMPTPTPDFINCYFNGSTERVTKETCHDLNGQTNPITSIPSQSPAQQNINKYPVNSDSPVLCNVSSNCGGGTKPLKKSECDNSTCCQIGDKWVFYTDKVQCGRDQANQGRSTSTGNNYYCWNNAYGYAYYTSSGDQCNIDNAKSTTYEICMTSQKIKSNTCGSICKTASDQGKQACSGLSAYPIDYYGQCLNGPGGVSEMYGTCMSKCTDQYSQDIQQCK